MSRDDKFETMMVLAPIIFFTTLTILFIVFGLAALNKLNKCKCQDIKTSAINCKVLPDNINPNPPYVVTPTNSFCLGVSLLSNCPMFLNRGIVAVVNKAAPNKLSNIPIEFSVS